MRILCAVCVGLSLVGCASTKTTSAGVDSPIPKERKPSETVYGTRQIATRSNNFEITQIAAVELGFAFGTKVAVCVFPPNERGRARSGITYDLDSIDSLLKTLAVDGPDAQSVRARISQAMQLEDSKVAANHLFEVLGGLQTSLVARGDSVLAEAMKVGLILGVSAESSAGALEIGMTDKDVSKGTAVLTNFWSPLPATLEVANLPVDLMSELPPQALSLKSVSDVVRLRDQILHFWTVCRSRRSAQDSSGTTNGHRLDSRTPGVAMQEHRHPHGFTFLYPKDWTYYDDSQNHATMLFPPGMSLEKQGPKALFLVGATRGYNRPLEARPFLQEQLKATQIKSYTQGAIGKDIETAAVMRWRFVGPDGKSLFDFAAYVVTVNNWAIHISAFGPADLVGTYEEKILRIVESISWQ